MNPWKALVVKHKARGVKPIPDGWLTRVQVAERIGCPENRVGENLRAAIAAKDVLLEKFPVWDAIEGKVVSVQCYRINERRAAPSPAKAVVGKWPLPEGTRVRRRDGKQEGVMLSGGRVEWADGHTSTPKGSTINKIVAA